jgi:hypothetical protein
VIGIILWAFYLIDEVSLIPPVPEGIREAAARGVLVPFVGAGTSILAGCPSWNELAKGALNDLLNKGLFSHAQLAQVENLDPRIKLSIALGIQKERPIDFPALLTPNGGYDNPMGRRVYGALSSMAKTFVTTNYDRWLDIEIDSAPSGIARSGKAPAVTPAPRLRKMFYEMNDFIPANLNSPGVFHIHGSLRDPNSMVMTTSHYLRQYANDHHTSKPDEENRLLTFLEYLFERKTVLFVGYGLEELEILEFVVQKARKTALSGAKEAKHYVLQGYFGHQIELMRSMRAYFLNECGIELIGFRRDERDWAQLADVLEAFALTISSRGPMLAQELSDMGGLLDE